MAGRLAWSISIEGIPGALSGLKDLDRVISGITVSVERLNRALSRLNFSGSGAASLPRASASGSHFFALGTSTHTTSSSSAQTAAWSPKDLALKALRAAGPETPASVKTNTNKMRETVRKASAIYETEQSHKRLFGYLRTSLGSEGTYADYKKSFAMFSSVHGTDDPAKILSNLQAQGLSAAKWLSKEAWVKSSLAAGGFTSMGKEVHLSTLAKMPWLLQGQKGWPFPTSGAPASGPGSGSPYVNPWTGILSSRSHGRILSMLPGAAMAGSTPGVGAGQLSHMLAAGSGRPPLLPGMGMRNALGGMGDAFMDFIPPKMLKFGLALGGLTVAVEGTKRGFEFFRESIRQGSDLYLRSARVGRPSGQVYALERAFGAVGIEPGMADRLMLSGQFGSQGSGGRGGSINVEGVRLGMRRIGDKGAIQQLENQIDVFTHVYGEVESQAATWQKMADQMRQIKLYTEEFSHNMQTLFSGLTGLLRDLSEKFTGMAATLSGYAAGGSGLMGRMARLSQVVAMIMAGNGAGLAGLINAGGAPTVPPSAGFKPFGGMTGGKGSPTGLERMGFIIGGGGDLHKYAAETARNTRVMADAMTRRGVSYPSLPNSQFSPTQQTAYQPSYNLP